MSWREITALRHNAILAYPTESCFGLGCDPRSAVAVRRLLAIKQRPAHKGLILLVSDMRQLRLYVNDSVLAAVLSSGYVAGRLTLLLPASQHCPAWVRGRHDKVAVRWTDFPPAKRLCQRLQTAIVSTSANRSGQRALRTVREVQRIFGKRVQMVAGRIGTARTPSRIVDWQSGRVLRF